MDIEFGRETIHCDTVYVILDKLCRVPGRPISAPRLEELNDTVGNKADKSAMVESNNQLTAQYNALNSYIQEIANGRLDMRAII
eukprot:4524915-Heterocapsa_arctica.AAC.1